MRKGFDKQVSIGDDGAVAALFAGIIVVLLFVVPVFIWENGFTMLLFFIGLLVGYFWPVIICSSADIDAHEEIKKLSEKQYDNFIKGYQIRHPSKSAVIWITLLTAWTGIGWFIALQIASSRKVITLPDAMVADLNSLAGISSNKPEQPAGNLELLKKEVGPQDDGVKPIRVSGSCRSCSAQYSLNVRPGEPAECDHCGTPIATLTVN